MSFPVTPKTPITPAHACIDDESHGHGKNSRVCAPVANNNKKIPICVRGRVTVTPGDVQWRDLPSILRVPELREHQCRCILAATDRDRDVLNVSPTGSGKTEGFLGAGLLRGGTTLIVSPLLALMADQFQRLEKLGIPCRLWNSTIGDKDKAETRRLIGRGWSGFIITTPESLRVHDFKLALSDRVNLGVIDEAHCTLRDSGFRVAYSRVGEVFDEIRVQRRYACTATLPHMDRQKLIEALRLDDPAVVTSPVARSNLSIHIVERDRDVLAHILNRHNDEAGIIFCATIATVKKLYGELVAQGRAVTFYYGNGLPPKQKAERQAEFMSGEKPVAAATDALGLGIDKADLRFIVHYDYPANIEAWVQGFGRAGRDGIPAHVYGCFRGSDEGFESRQFLLKSSFPPVADIARVWEYLTKAPYRKESAKYIGEHVLGYRGQYSGGNIITTLRRYELATAKTDPDDKRRKIYRGCGDFEAVNWASYKAESREAFKRLDQLCDLVELPDDEIPQAIDEYFEGEKRDSARRASA